MIATGHGTARLTTLHSIARHLSSDARKGTLFVFVFALVPRLLIAFHLPNHVIWPDGYRYLQVADNLLSGHGFGSLEANRQSVPTQPLLIAAVWAVCGHGILALRCLFSIIGSVSAALGYLLARRLFGSRTALLAGILIAVYPHLAYLSALFEYPQTFFIFLMSLAFLEYYAFLDTGRVYALALTGLLLGLGVLTVPTAVLFAPVLIVHAALWVWPRRPRAFIAILLLCVALPVGAWTCRNYLRYGTFILVNESGGFNFWLANNETYSRLGKQSVTPPCASGFRDTKFCEQFLSLYRKLGAQHLSPDELVLREDRTEWRYGMEFLAASPWRALGLTLRKFYQFWDPVPDALNSDGILGRSTARWIAVVCYTPILLLGLSGMAALADRWATLLPIYGYFCVLTLTYSVFLPATRYRLPLDFFLLIFSAHLIAIGLGNKRLPLLRPAVRPGVAPPG